MMHQEPSSDDFKLHKVIFRVKEQESPPFYRIDGCFTIVGRKHVFEVELTDRAYPLLQLCASDIDRREFHGWRWRRWRLERLLRLFEWHGRRGACYFIGNVRLSNIIDVHMDRRIRFIRSIRRSNRLLTRIMWPIRDDTSIIMLEGTILVGLTTLSVFPVPACKLIRCQCFLGELVSRMTFSTIELRPLLRINSHIGNFRISVLHPPSVVVSVITLFGRPLAAPFMVQPIGTGEWWPAIFTRYEPLHIPQGIVTAIFILISMHEATFFRTSRAITAKPPRIAY
jgi:hypothetical protein